MKKQALLLIACSVFLATDLFSQTSIGISGTYGKSWQHYGDDFQVSGRDLKIDGYTIALSMYYHLMPHLAVGVEPGLTRRGSACLPGFIWDNPTQFLDATLYANYLQLPLMIRGEFDLGQSNFFLFGKLGGGPAYMVKGSRKVTFIDQGVEEETQDIDFAEEENLNRLDVGAYGGAGIGFRLGKGAIQIASNYYYGFLDVDDQLTSENRSLQFGLGYQVKL